MYFENGNLRDNEAIKSIERLLSETPRNPLVQRPNNHLDNTHLTMQGNIIPHSKPFASTKAAGDNEAFTQAIKEFGENYPQFYHKGSEAIEHLLQKRSGQVQGAFYRKDLEELSGNGDITLVWGEITDAQAHKGYGLAHILDKRTAEFMIQGLEQTQAQIKAKEFVESLPKMIDEMDLKVKPNEAIKLENENYKIILKSNWKGEPTDKWIVSAYIKKEKGESISSTPFTKEDNLPLNSNAIIPQSNPNTNLALRANTIPTATQEDIIDVEVIQKYIAHTPRNKLSEDLNDLTKLYPETFTNKASVLQNTLRMLNNPKLLNAPQNPQQEIIKETLAQKSGAYKQGSLFDEKDLAEIPQNNAVVKENLTTQNPQDYTTLQKQLFGNSEQLKNTSNMEFNGGF